MFEQTGIPERDMIIEKFPPVERIDRGPVAIVECYKRIPCNPCETACRFNAIRVGEDINNIPVTDHEACTGCKVCISKCPGLAIMAVDGSKSKETVEISLPYEFLPLPQKGDQVSALDRAGNFVARVRVVSVLNPKSFDRTPVITIEADRKHMYDIRNIRTEEH
ncbi:MAG: ferredoxin [Firmicutes bacterium ADurb.Bin182]|nr:MAG: ferredoxin [Firmicutes bacterium ADurb.Bin182]